MSKILCDKLFLSCIAFCCLRVYFLTLQIIPIQIIHVTYNDDLNIEVGIYEQTL